MAQIAITTEYCWHECPECGIQGHPYTRIRDVRVGCFQCKVALERRTKKGLFIVVASRTVGTAYDHRGERLFVGKVDGRMTVIDDS